MQLGEAAQHDAAYDALSLQLVLAALANLSYLVRQTRADPNEAILYSLTMLLAEPAANPQPTLASTLLASQPPPCVSRG